MTDTVKPVCDECSDLPWRRPRNRRRLCACGESYADEPPDYEAPERERPRTDRILRSAQHRGLAAELDRRGRLS